MRTFKKLMASCPITSWQIDGGELETLTDFIFLGSKITADSDCSCEIKRCLLLGRKAYGYGGYGYGGYGYGNYYNYLMMASYMNSGSTTSESVSSELDKDRYYRCTLAGPNAADESLRPTLKITFSAPKTAEQTK